ncbi:MAG: ERF family protein [Tissierellaceae bacterium]|nr:ERF family protein [Tissierellaceae bacterium]
MEKSESIKEIALALSKFQGEVLNPKNTNINPNFNSKYAPLSEVINTIKSSLTKNGLSIVQAPYTEGEYVIVETILLHNSGEWIKSPPLKLKMEQPTAQGAGSAITYGRRYAISALLNISSEEDNDGNESTDDIDIDIDVNEETQNDDSNNENVEDLITNRQIKYVHVLANEKGIDNTSIKNYIISVFNKDSTKDLTKKEASSLIEILKTLPGGNHV